MEKEYKDIQNKLYNFEVDLPDNDWDAIAQRLPQNHKSRVLPLWWQRVAAIAMLLLLAGGGLLWWSHHNSTVAPFPSSTYVAKAPTTIVSDIKQTVATHIGASTAPQVSSVSTPSSVATELIAAHRDHSNAIPRPSIQSTECVPMVDSISENQEYIANQPATSNQLSTLDHPQLMAQNQSVDTVQQQPSHQLTIEESQQLLEQQYNANTALAEQAGGAKLKDQEASKHSSDGFSLGALASLNTDAFSSTMLSSTPFSTNSSMMNSSPVGLRISSQHDFPVTVGLKVGFNLVNHLDLQTGVNYTYLHSKFVTSTGGANTRYDNQMLHYIGIPVSLSYRFLNTRFFNMYVLGGGMIEKGISQINHANIVTPEHVTISTSRSHSSIEGFQWSINGNLGFSFIIYKGLQLYAEPGLAWFIPNDKYLQPESQRTASPLSFNLQCGLRYAFVRK